MNENVNVWLIVGAVVAVMAIVAAICIFLIIKNKKRSVAEQEKLLAQQALREAEAEAEKRENERRERELIAAITATISAYLAAEAEADGRERSKFRVVSFERVSGARPWNTRM